MVNMNQLARTQPTSVFNISSQTLCLQCLGKSSLHGDVPLGPMLIFHIELTQSIALVGILDPL